ncbi:unnamed protein product [Rotaria magnacalcarata]
MNILFGLVSFFLAQPYLGCPLNDYLLCDHRRQRLTNKKIKSNYNDTGADRKKIVDQIIYMIYAKAMQI